MGVDLDAFVVENGLIWFSASNLSRFSYSSQLKSVQTSFFVLMLYRSVLDGITNLRMVVQHSTFDIGSKSPGKLGADYLILS